MVDKLGCEKLKINIFNPGNEEALKKWGKLSRQCCEYHKFLMERAENGFCGEGFCRERKRNSVQAKKAAKEATKDKD